MIVAVLSGGRSSEHEVSLASGEAVRGGLAEAGHEVLDVRIARDGTWSLDGAPVVLEPGRGLLGAGCAFCSSAWTSRTSAPASSPPRCAWTRCSSRS